MHTISMLRRTLGLASDNQVRNRIERIKELLAEHIRRGPNNQIFLTEPGLDLMKQLQELYDTGLTLAEASQVVRVSVYAKATSSSSVSSGSAPNATNPDQPAASPSSPLQDEMAQIRKHVAAIERQLPPQRADESCPAEVKPWWISLREDVDVT